MLNSNGKRHYCIDDIINENKPSKRQPLGDATNYCLPNIAERKIAVARSDDERDDVAGPRGLRGNASGNTCETADVDSIVESLLPCRKISLRAPAGEDMRRLAASFPDVHVFPQRPIKSLEALDPGSLRERHHDWCEAFRAAYQRGCRLYVTHSTFAAVFWAERGVAVVSRSTPGFKRLLEANGVSFDEQGSTAVKVGGRHRIVVGRSTRPESGGRRHDAAALHGLFDVILNEVIGAGVGSKRSDIFKGDFPRLYCEAPFRHSSAVVWEEAFDRKRGEVVGYLPAWVLQRLLSERGRVASFERMLDFSF